MRYAIDVLDEEGARVAELTGIAEARLREKVNALAILTVETVGGQGWDAVVPGRSFLRLREVPATSRGVYRVIEARKCRDRERLSLAITARSLLGDAADELFADAVDCINHTPAQLAEVVLAHSSFAVGTVGPDTNVPFVRFEYEPVLDCLLRICSLCGGELAVDEEEGRIDILAQIGGDEGATLRYGATLSRASRALSTSRLANRVYGVGGGEPPLEVTDATEGSGQPYAEDDDSVEAWGLHEAAFHDPTLEDTENLVAAPALDGAYTDGLCEGWTNMGAVVSKNTDPGNILYGRASQRVATSGDGQGISQSVATTAGRTYSLLAHIIIASGKVRVRVDDGSAVYRRQEGLTGTGLAAVRIENWKALTSSVTVKIVQEGAGTADFYVDSVQIAEGASAKPFIAGKAADLLWERTIEYLAAHKDPEITYEVELAEVSGEGADGNGIARFGLGDTVRVIDPVLDLDIRTRVMELETDILRPGKVKVKLDTPSRGLADALGALRLSQAEGIRHTRAALAASSTASESGSSRNVFSGQSFRFFGTITAAGWNSVSWSAGTLRVGDAWFTVSAGSATGLGGYSTYHFSFDRSSPGTFGYTTSGAEAEGEDCILLFTVTTTSSSYLCVIHPMGIVRV
jgi:hypothetical protein